MCASEERKGAVMNIYFLVTIWVVVLWACIGLCATLTQKRLILTPWRERLGAWSAHAEHSPEVGIECKEWEATNSVYHEVCLKYAHIAEVVRQRRLLLIEWKIWSRDTRQELALLKGICIE